jgi:hypothetical protein
LAALGESKRLPLIFADLTPSGLTWEHLRRQS